MKVLVFDRVVIIFTTVVIAMLLVSVVLVKFQFWSFFKMVAGMINVIFAIVCANEVLCIIKGCIIRLFCCYQPSILMPCHLNYSFKVDSYAWTA